MRQYIANKKKINNISTKNMTTTYLVKQGNGDQHTVHDDGDDKDDDQTHLVIKYQTYSKSL